MSLLRGVPQSEAISPPPFSPKMLPVSGAEEATTIYNNNNPTRTCLHRVSSSSSTSSSSSPFSRTNLHLQNPQARTMEEVWKDLNLSSLHDHTRLRGGSNQNPNFILQDFLARPFTKDPPTRIVPTHCDNTTTLYATALPPPATVLSLNPGPGFDLLDNSSPLRPTSHSPTDPISNVSSFPSPFETLDSPPGLLCFSKKRVQECDSGSGDRRHKRMIKNRESAARSRARKQAYTYELELEIAHLQEENARLKKQQQELCVAAAAQLPKKRSLLRTATAPF